MKILLIYTPRSGSTSVLKYFSSVMPEFICYNEPWFTLTKNALYSDIDVSYERVLEHDDVFVKSSFMKIPVDIEKTVRDFDKVLILMRRNTREQSESSVLANKERSYFDRTIRRYRIYSVSEYELHESIKSYERQNTILCDISRKHNIPIFYYEDLYYGDFRPIFDELGVRHDEGRFMEFLHSSNRYRAGDIQRSELIKTKKFI